jgi:hypothetical protein
MDKRWLCPDKWVGGGFKVKVPTFLLRRFSVSFQAVCGYGCSYSRALIICTGARALFTRGSRTLLVWHIEYLAREY